MVWSIQLMEIGFNDRHRFIFFFFFFFKDMNVLGKVHTRAIDYEISSVIKERCEASKRIYDTNIICLRGQPIPGDAKFSPINTWDYASNVIPCSGMIQHNCITCIRIVWKIRKKIIYFTYMLRDIFQTRSVVGYLYRSFFRCCLNKVNIYLHVHQFNDRINFCCEVSVIISVETYLRYAALNQKTYLKVIGDTIVRIHAAKDVAIITIMSDAIFARFNVLRDFPRNVGVRGHGDPDFIVPQSFHG
ncbi:hypothetical protein PUN28_004695 [Cardiocondyla obscurior]|uniref:Uncharacterized protein n=1 Tax=Cardiocondyla obscurior TaxID=286306 RepID=A0AAW2GG44_9HYME